MTSIDPQGPRDTAGVYWSEPAPREDGRTIRACLLDISPPSPDDSRWASSLHYYGGLCETDTNGDNFITIVTGPRTAKEAAGAACRQAQEPDMP